MIIADAVDDGAQRSQHAAEAMIERHGNADPIGGRQPLALADVKGVHQQIAVAQRGRLGKAGRAGRVLNVDRLIGPQLAADLVQAAFGHALATLFQVRTR